MRVYRYEHPTTGNGPYRFVPDVPKYDNIKYQLSHEHYASSNHPSLYQDGLDNNGEMFTACRSIESLKKWFSTPQDYNEILPKYGFEIVTYEVPKQFVEFGYSHKQLTFEKAKATKINC